MRNYLKGVFGLMLLLILTGCATGVQEGEIVNFHEHIKSEKEVAKLLVANERVGITRTVLMGSPKETIYFNGEKGFSDYEQYNEVILAIAEKYPDQFAAYPTIYWQDSDQLTKLKEYVKRGAKGVKIYQGHGFFHDEMPLDDPLLNPIYDYLETIGLPTMFHVNFNKYDKEFLRVLRAHPNMIVICPHFCLTSKKPQRLESLFEEFPNFYTDISFGYEDYAKQGLKRLAANPSLYHDLLTKWSDRFLFGTDTVVTGAAHKNADWMEKMFQPYRDMLEKEEYAHFMMPDDPLRGLYLDQNTLNKIYYENPRKLLTIQFP